MAWSKTPPHDPGYYFVVDPEFDDVTIWESLYYDSDKELIWREFGASEEIDVEQEGMELAWYWDEPITLPSKPEPLPPSTAEPREIDV